jgi:hypothetical protein
MSPRYIVIAAAMLAAATAYAGESNKGRARRMHPRKAASFS